MSKETKGGICSRCHGTGEYVSNMSQSGGVVTCEKCWGTGTITNIKIIMLDGVVHNVEGLPAGWTYEVIEK